MPLQVSKCAFNIMLDIELFSFLAALRANPNQSYLQLLNSVRTILREKYDQRPQLSSSHPIDINLLFMI
jgi:hypothetical protein